MNMCVVIDSKVVISNAFYAMQKKDGVCSTLEYNVVDQFKKILYQRITKKYRYVLFSTEDSNCIEIFEHTFIKENDGILCVNSLDDSFIKRVNSFYSSDIQNIIEQSRSEIENIRQLS